MIFDMAGMTGANPRLSTTSSGKLSRSRAKTDYLAGVYGPPGEALRGGVPGGAS